MAERLTLAEQIALAERLIGRHHGAESAGLADIARTLRTLQQFHAPVREAIIRAKADVAELERLREEDPAVAEVLEVFPDAEMRLTEPAG